MTVRVPCANRAARGSATRGALATGRRVFAHRTLCGDALPRWLRATRVMRRRKLATNASASRAFVERIPSRRVARILHVGPYADEKRSFDEMLAHAAQAGLAPANAHSEIYLNDPRRTKPANVKTVLILEVAPPSKDGGAATKLVSDAARRHRRASITSRRR